MIAISFLRRRARSPLHVRRMNTIGSLVTDRFGGQFHTSRTMIPLEEPIIFLHSRFADSKFPADFVEQFVIDVMPFALKLANSFPNGDQIFRQIMYGPPVPTVWKNLSEGVIPSSQLAFYC